MIDCRFKPIQKWPNAPTPKEKRYHRFRAKWVDTLALLEFEVEALRRNHSDTSNGNVDGLQLALATRNRIRELKGWR